MCFWVVEWGSLLRVVFYCLASPVSCLIGHPNWIIFQKDYWVDAVGWIYPSSPLTTNTLTLWPVIICKLHRTNHYMILYPLPFNCPQVPTNYISLVIPISQPAWYFMENLSCCRIFLSLFIDSIFVEKLEYSLVDRLVLENFKEISCFGFWFMTIVSFYFTRCK